MSPVLLPTPSELIEELDGVMYGQPEAKRALALACYKHALRAAAVADRKKSALMADATKHVLLVGPTGVGKTFLVRELTKLLDIPVAFCTATSLVESGYVGEQAESTVRALLHRAGGNVACAESGIIVVDEIDKIRRCPGSGRDVSGEGVQNAFLSLFDGVEIPVYKTERPGYVDTRGVLFICMGAFVGLDEIIAERKTAHSEIGFCGAVEGHPHRQPEVHGERLMPEDLVAYGLIPEFVGRFGVVRRLDALTRSDLREILRDGRSPAMRRAQEFLALHHAKAELSPGALDEIAHIAASMETGARALDRVLGDVLEPLEWHVASSERPVKHVFVTEETVRTGATPRFSYWRKPPDRELLKTLRSSGQPVPVGDYKIRLTPTSGWTKQRIWKRVALMKVQLGFPGAIDLALRWWSDFENENKDNPENVLALAEELVARKATITEFFLAYVASNTDFIRANLFYMDFLRAKKAGEEKAKARKAKEQEAEEDDEAN